MKTKVITPFNTADYTDMVDHVRELRRLFDWPGIAYHNPPDGLHFNRWGMHNVPLLMKRHHQLTALACDLFGEAVKPSYVFLSMYGPNGICPEHKDRPQCKYTIDLQLSGDCAWPIYIQQSMQGNKPKFNKFVLKNGQALTYSGVDQIHYRKCMAEDSTGARGKGRGTSMNMVFFHFVPLSWQGALT